MTNFTQDQLLLYYYNELNIQESKYIEELLKKDSKINLEYQNLINTLNSLNIEPSNKVCNRIKKYSESTYIIDSEYLEYLKLNLN